MQSELNGYNKILVISPHLDDGVLSVGGIIQKAAAQGADVVVATAFTADTPSDDAISPLASQLHALWDLGPNPYQHRRNEDIAAVVMLGGRTLHGQLLDALYRTDHGGSALYATRQSIFSAPSEHDSIGEALFDLLEHWTTGFSPDLILSPLGVGRHLDHIVTTDALQRLSMVRPMTVALYEDMPYATGVFPAAAPDTVEAALKRTSWQVTASHVVPVELSGKLEAIEAYASQIADIFPNGIEVGSVLDDYMRLGGPMGTYGERLWTVS